KKILKIKALKRVRLSSIDVGEINDEIIKLIAGERRICRHFHIPVQSGDDQILSAMGRNYKVKDFFDKIKVIQRGIKDVAVTTDVIVGFPGESESSFEKTYNLLKELDLKKIHVFKYSPRKKTRAAEMVNQVSIEEKRKRSKKLQELSDSLGSRFAKKSIGAEVEVLVEEGKGLHQYGLTDNYLKVYFESKDDLKGKLVKVKLLKTEKHLAFGELIS
ncbi:MAG: radical SAM protein, partial [Actinomycetia bacterium]|nr:radical SAM protein [Actinomycetes bacterium]